MRGHVTVLDPSGSLLDLARPALEVAGYDVTGVRSVDELVERVEKRRAVVVIDACQPLEGGPPRLVAALRRRANASILQVSGCAAVDAASRRHPYRADRFLVRPFREIELVAAVDDLSGNGHPGEDSLGGMIGGSEAMRGVFRAVRLVAPTEATVLICGETGTGKERIAGAVHALSASPEGPFVPVQCGALPESLLEAELFGHVKGAFTGAERQREGLVGAAEGGTLFLDEIASTPPRLQTRLLRVLEERQVRPVGSARPRDVDLRVLAATSRDLEREVERGSFRADLYFRLRVFTIRLPPLRDREGDVRRIVAACLDGWGAAHDGPPRGISAEALRRLETYFWPGNVRELLAVLESASIRAGGETIRVEHLPPELHRRQGEPRGAAAVDHAASTVGSPGDDGEASERERILGALREAGGHRARAARMLGFSRTTLWRRIRALGITPPDD
ncbi:MAG: sigma-54 dependent transcriptional regulator [Gemmatimonadota bacterium]|jgi:two-component system response regulator GlrR